MDSASGIHTLKADIFSAQMGTLFQQNLHSTKGNALELCRFKETNRKLWDNSIEQG